MKKNFYKIKHDLEIEKTEIKKIKKKAKTDKNKISDNFFLAKYFNIGYYLISPLVLGIFFGFFLDKIFVTKKLFFLISFSLGVIGSFYNLWKIVKEVK